MAQVRSAFATGAVALAGALVSSCSSRPASTVPSGSFVSVDLVGLTVGPGKADGSRWDGFGAIPDAAARAIGRALDGSGPFVAVMSELSRPVVASLERPDICGVGRLVTAGRTSHEIRFEGDRDSFTPHFSDARWTHIPVDGSVRLRVEAVDEDFQVDDPAGTFELGAEDFRRGAEEGNVFPVRVDQQTNRQVLFASISVFVENSPGR